MAALSLLAAYLVAPSAAVSAQSVTAAVANGPSGNRFDVAIVGDGYTAAEMGRFATDASNTATALFDEEPFKEYASYFNVHRVDVSSAQSGADHPLAGTYVNTAFDATFNCGGIERTICVDDGKVYSALADSLTPDQYDVVIVIVNDAEYGGSGGGVAVASTDVDSLEIVRHELGHTIAGLADEYTDGGPSCETYETGEPNATRVTQRSKIKWSRWINTETPIPTPGSTNGVVGLYEGARYCDTGTYRPTYDSKMRSLNSPFEQVNSEALVLRFYNFVSPIDGTTPAADIVNAGPEGRPVFTVATLRPATHNLTVTWSVDGRAVSHTTSFTLDSAGLSTGTHEVSVDVQDPTGTVRSDPGSLLRAQRRWTVQRSDNYVGNPSFETDLSGWGSFQGTLSRVALSAAPDGGYVARVARASGSRYSISDNQGGALPSVSSTVAGKNYQASGSVKAANSGAVNKPVELYLRERRPDGSVVREWKSTATLTTAWQRLTVKVTATASGDTLGVRMEQQNATTGNALYADAFSVATPK